MNYPDLTRADLMEAVERFYDEYYFRPRAAWRVVRKALTDAHEFKRLFKEAREFMALRSKRRKFVTEQKAAKPAVAAHSGD